MDTIASTPGYGSQSADIAANNIGELYFPDSNPAVNNYPNYPTNPVVNNYSNYPTNPVVNNYSNYPTNPTVNNYPINSNNYPTNSPVNNNPAANPINSFQNNFSMTNTIDFHTQTKNFSPTYGMQPNYGSGMKMTGMSGITSSKSVTSRMTYLPGSKAVTNMTMIPKIEPKRTNQKKKEIIYPEFLSIISQITDEFWIKVLNLSAIGNFPRGIVYHNSVLTYKKNNKITITQELSGNDVDKAKTYIKFLEEKLSIHSETDNKRNDEKLMEGVGTVVVYNSWNDIRKKKVKEALLNNFLAETSDKLQFTDEQYNTFRETLYRAYYSNIINNTNIVLDQGKIVTIKALSYDPVTKTVGIINTETAPPKKKEKITVLLESQYLNPKMIINGKCNPVDLNKKLETTIKSLYTK